MQLAIALRRSAKSHRGSRPRECRAGSLRRRCCAHRRKSHSRERRNQAAAQAISALAYRIHIKRKATRVRSTVRISFRLPVAACASISTRATSVSTRNATTAHAPGRWTAMAKSVNRRREGARALWHGTHYPGQILALAELPAHGHRIDSIGRERIDGIDYDVLKLTMSDGFETYRYVNWLKSGTHRTITGRSRAVTRHGTRKKTLLDTHYTDFRYVDGVLRPFSETQTDLKTGKWNQTATVHGQYTSCRGWPTCCSSADRLPPRPSDGLSPCECSGNTVSGSEASP